MGCLKRNRKFQSQNDVRFHAPIQPLTVDFWSSDSDLNVYAESELIALELSDVITFHFYGCYSNMIKLIENLKEKFDRPLIINEWLNRVEHSDIDDLFPLFYLEKICSYYRGLIQGYSQTYELWGRIF